MNSKKVVKPASTSELRAFGLLVGAVFLAVGLWPMLHHLSPRTWALIVAAGLIVPALISPSILAVPYQLWLKIGGALGWFNTRLILTILYFIAVLPVAIILRLTGKTPLKLKFDPAASSYREPPEETREINLTEQF